MYLWTFNILQTLKYHQIPLKRIFLFFLKLYNIIYLFISGFAPMINV